MANFRRVRSDWRWMVVATSEVESRVVGAVYVDYGVTTMHP